MAAMAKHGAMKMSRRDSLEKNDLEIVMFYDTIKRCYSNIPQGSMVLEYLPTNWDYLENYILGSK